MTKFNPMEMISVSMIRCLDALEALGIKYDSCGETKTYSFSYFGVKMGLNGSPEEGGITLSAEFDFNSRTPDFLMKCLEEIVCREHSGYIVRAVSPAVGIVAKEWMLDWEEGLSSDDMKSMLDKTVQAWHTVAFNLYMTRECEADEYII